MKYFALIVILLVSFWDGKAQVDTVVYKVELSIGYNLYGQIVAKEEGSFITLLKVDGSIQYLQWHEIKSCETTKYSVHGTDVKNIQLKEKVARTYAGWNKGYLVIKSDTFFCRIYPKNDYSAFGPGLERVVHTVSDGGVEKSWEPYEYDRLVITEQDTVSYLCYAPGENFKVSIFKILNDGACKLLQDRYEKQEKPVEPGTGEVSFIRPSHGGTDIMFTPPDFTKTTIRYYLLYKDEWIKTEVENEPITDFQFTYIAEANFGDCPQLVTQLKNKTFGSKDLRDIVVTFNKCVSVSK